MKKFIKTLILTLLFIIFLLICLVTWLTISDFQPQEIENAEIIQRSDSLASETISIFNWNIGYGGLGEEMDFFMDGGSRVRAPEEEYTIYRKGIMDVIEKSSSQIYFFQEVDRKSTRSYYEDQYESISKILNGYTSSFAPNYKVKFIPSPTIIGTQYGSVQSGLSIFSKYSISESARISLPGNYKWPKKVFFLDRCMLVSKITNEDDKTIVLINTHKSAYDKGGFLKKEQLDYIKGFAISEYNKEHFVIIGGDWNSYMPGTDGDSFKSEEPAPDFYQTLPEDWEMTGWQWAIDRTTPTNRSLALPYERGKTFTSAIDGFLLSPNVNLLDVKTIDLDFEFSDHNPIELVVELK